MTKQSKPSNSPSAKTGGDSSLKKAQSALEAKRQTAGLKLDEPSKLSESTPKPTSPSEPDKGLEARRERQREIDRRLGDMIGDPADHEARRQIRLAELPLRHVEADTDTEGPEWFGCLGQITAAIRDRKAVLIHGRRGTGKTQAAVSAAMSIVRTDRKTARYFKTGALLRHLREEMHQGRENSSVKALCKPYLLILDEVHVVNASDYSDRTMTDLIDERYDRKLPTLLITNESREAAGERLGSSAVSRFKEQGVVVEMNGKSYRTTQGGAA